MQHGSIAAIVGVIVLQLLGVISREQHKHQDRNRAKHDIHHAKARAGQHADQAAHQAGQNNGNQSTHQVDTPAAQIALGSGTVNSHNAKVHGTNQERQNQRGKIIDDKVGAQVDAVQHRIGKEQPRCGGGLQAFHPSGQNRNQHQLRNAQEEYQAGAEHQLKQRGGNGKQCRCKGNQQTGGHPAVGAGHILV